jgi:ribosomal protein L16/L10AE
MRRVVVAICAALLVTSCSEPPQKEIDRAQGAIDAARAAGADQYATEPFTAATTAMQQTHEAVQQRDYRLALSRATDANERALEAARQAANGKARARSEAEAALASVSTTLLRQLDERIKMAESSRLTAREIEAARRARLDADRAVQEARAAIASGDYLAASDTLKAAAATITSETRTMNEAIDAKTGRGKSRRR